MFKRLFTAALVFGAAALAPPAYAQDKITCLERDALVQTLETRYHETLQGAGLQGPQLLLEIWSSDDTGSFTVIVTTPSGKSCVVASGQNWHNVRSVPKVGVTG